MWASRPAVAPATPTPTACAKKPTTRWYVQPEPAQSANETTASPNRPPSTTPIVSPATISLRTAAPPHTRVERWRLFAVFAR